MADGDIYIKLEFNNQREILQAKLDIRGYDYQVSELDDQQVASLVNDFNSLDSASDLDAAVRSYFES